MLNKITQKMKNLLTPKFIPEGVSSYPFISGDTFRAFASHIIDLENNQLQLIKKNTQNHVYFVNMDLFNSFNLVDMIPPRSALIVHNGDGSPRQKNIENLINREIAVYAVNLKLDAPMDNVHCLPIGIENAHWNKNGALNYYNGNLCQGVTDSRTAEIIVSFTLGTNLEKRSYYRDIAEKYGYINLNGLTSVSFRNMLRSQMFILCPPGNGIDCHRTWEAIYHGCIPVIETQDWLFGSYELPVMVVDRLDDFFKLSDLEKAKIYQSLIKHNKHIAYMDYWVQEILK